MLCDRVVALPDKKTMKLSSGDCVLIGKNEFLVDMKSATSLTLARPATPYSRLRITASGSIEVSSDAGKGCIFVLEGENLKALRSSVKTEGKHYYLSVDDSGNLCTTLHTTTLPIQLKSPLPLCILTPYQKRRFISEGYLHIPQLVSEKAIFQAQRYLMHCLGQPGALVAGGAQPGMGKLAGRASNAPEIQQLLQGSVMQLLDELLGANNIDNITNMSAQIALRFPELVDGHQRIDGTSWHTDGLRQGKRHPFSVLVGICLSDCLQEFAGNLLVWPGTHTLLHRLNYILIWAIAYMCYRSTRNESGAVDCDLLEQLYTEFCTSGHVSDKEANTWDNVANDNAHNNEPDNLTDLGQPHQVLARAGVSRVLYRSQYYYFVGRGAIASRYSAYWRS